MRSPESPSLRYDVDRYFALAEAGVIAPDERTELLDGIIVAMAPQSPLHAAAVYRVECALRDAFPPHTIIRGQLTFVAGPMSVPEPDIAVVAGTESDYLDRHPSTALLVVEVALTSVAQDRLTKAGIYAGAGAMNYWIVQPDKEWVEVYSGVRAEHRVYDSVVRVGPDAVLELDGVAGVKVRASDLFPRRVTS